MFLRVLQVNEMRKFKFHLIAEFTSSLNRLDQLLSNIDIYKSIDKY